MPIMMSVHQAYLVSLDSAPPGKGRARHHSELCQQDGQPYAAPVNGAASTGCSLMRAGGGGACRVLRFWERNAVVCRVM